MAGNLAGCYDRTEGEGQKMTEQNDMPGRVEETHP